MPLLLRFLVVAVLAYIAGSIVTPLVWGPVLVRQSKEIISPYALISAGIFIAAVGYAINAIRRK